MRGIFGPAVVGWLIIGCSACVVPNEDFNGPRMDAESACTGGATPENATREGAMDLGAVPESSDLRHVDGRLGEPGDADWYKFTGLDVRGRGIPRAQLQDFAELRVCAFVRCPDGSVPTIDNCVSPELDETGAGCCNVRTVLTYYDCTAPGDVSVYVRVDGAEACTDYTLEYRF